MGGKKRLTKKSNASDTPTYPVSKEKAELKNDRYPPSSDEHLHHPYPKKQHILKRILKIEHEIPAGIKMLLVFSTILGLLYILLASLFSFTIVFGKVIQGTGARLLNIVIILLVAFMIFGFAKRKIWGYYLANTIFTFVILNSFVSMFFIKKSVSGLLTLFVTLSFFFILMMNLITLWYIRHKKTYFIYRTHPLHSTREDKAYVYGLVLLWITFIFIAGVIGDSYYQETTQKVDYLIEELYYVSPEKVESFCSDGLQEKDLCLLTGAVIYQDEANSNKLCKGIESYFYKYTCFKAIQGDIA